MEDHLFLILPEVRSLPFPGDYAEALNRFEQGLRRLKHEEYTREYHRKFIRIKNAGYIGVVTCPKCGRKGYADLRHYVNSKTESVYGLFLRVKHHHKRHGKIINDGECRLGVVKQKGDVKRLLSEEGSN